MNARLHAPLLAFALVGCSGLARDGAAVPRWSGVMIERGVFRSATGCLLDTTRFQPRRPRTSDLAILAPGFLRDQRQLAGLALALAGRGIPVVTLTFCNTSAWDGRPIRNALDMMAVGRRLGATAVVYAGFSAGGLAALIAGRLDRHAVGVVALDLVDAQGLGVGMARALDRPLVGLAGAPAACNAYNNGLKVFAVAPRASVTPIPWASHCDFESPTDWLCESLCTGVDQGSAARRRTIVAATVTAVSDLIGPLPPTGP
ncbi:alpha/beta hydrolase [uncultured Thiodictyon sp.]|uniref:alpha/beta hydrolase n=1 Tax=uncultured Thiodictyon sp. TaxID=1846217 RepID=UPI0025E46EF5|nr:alpha/beta hydrolase [uncultured Thiodictyon sp.]